MNQITHLITTKCEVLEDEFVRVTEALSVFGKLNKEDATAAWEAFKHEHKGCWDRIQYCKNNRSPFLPVGDIVSLLAAVLQNKIGEQAKAALAEAMDKRGKKKTKGTKRKNEDNDDSEVKFKGPTTNEEYPTVTQGRKPRKTQVRADWSFLREDNDDDDLETLHPRLRKRSKTSHPWYETVDCRVAFIAFCPHRTTEQNKALLQLYISEGRNFKSIVTHEETIGPNRAVLDAKRQVGHLCSRGDVRINLPSTTVMYCTPEGQVMTADESKKEEEEAKMAMQEAAETLLLQKGSPRQAGYEADNEEEVSEMEDEKPQQQEQQPIKLSLSSGRHPKTTILEALTFESPTLIIPGVSPQLVSIAALDPDSFWMPKNMTLEEAALAKQHLAAVRALYTAAVQRGGA